MGFVTIEKKGIAKMLADESLDPESLSVHISQVEAGARCHPPHSHEGLEVFYVIEGTGTVEIGDETHTLGPNEGILLDPTREHGIVNTGTTPIRYMVIIARQ